MLLCLGLESDKAKVVLVFCLIHQSTWIFQFLARLSNSLDLSVSLWRDIVSLFCKRLQSD